MITPAQLKKFWKALDEGASVTLACKTGGFSTASGYKILREKRGRELVGGRRQQTKHFSQRPSEFRDGRSRGQEDLPEPTPLDDLCDEARHALEDFHYFSQRYFGRAPTPWRKDAADRILELYESPDKEFAVINTPPGVGKTTLFTHDIPAWLTVRDRAIRGILGSWGITAGSTFTRTLRTTLERTALAPTSDDDIRKGVEFPTEGILAVDFGRFKPLGQSDFWTASSFTVEQLDGRAPADKEPTWTAFGNGEIIGWRVNFLIFDDLVTTRKLDSEAEQKKMQRWWDQEVERRVEPGGLCLLEGQRLGASDHYRYCLDKLDLDEGDDIQGWDPDDPRNDSGPKKKYHHIVYKGHYEDRCADTENLGSKHPDHHPKTAKPFPEGCLLDPHRCSFREQMRERATNPVLYSTVYQQDDTDPDQVLVPKVWIDGDEGHPGCWDADRDSWEMPAWPDGTPKLAPPFITVVSVDPSPTKNWAVQCVAAGQRVSTMSGEVPIERVRVGDLVWTRMGWRPVRQVHDNGVRPTVELALSNGRTLRVTPDHRVATPFGWREAGALSVGSALLAPASVGLPATDEARPGSRRLVGVRPHHEAPVDVGVPVLAVGAVAAGDGVRGSLGVLREGDGFEVVGVDAGGVLAEVVDRQPFGYVAFPEAVGEAVGEPFAGRSAVDPAVAPSILAGGPLPAPRLGDLAPLGDECLVVGDLHGPGLDPVGAGLASVGAPDGQGGSAFHTQVVHVESITAASSTRVYDLGIDGCHEFVAEGIIVHNCWVIHPASETYVLLDLFRGQMEAPSFLYGEESTGVYTGMLEDLRKEYARLGIPLRNVIFERNVAQRWFTQSPYVKAWGRKHQVRWVEHETTPTNKRDTEFGLTMLRPLFEYGQIRLPGKQVPRGHRAALYTGRRNAIKLVNELTRYSLQFGASGTDDQIMACWMMAHRAKSLAKPEVTEMPKLNPSAPSWMTRARALVGAPGAGAR